MIRLHLSLPVHGTESGESPGTKTIIFDRSLDRATAESCLLGAAMGVHVGYTGPLPQPFQYLEDPVGQNGYAVF